MKHTIDRLLRPVRRLLHPAPPRQPAPGTSPTPNPYAYAYVDGLTTHRTGERPPRGEDSPLVRPYFVAHERQVAEARRRQRRRGGKLWVAVRGVELGPCAGSGSRAVA
ncbi:hypothetical protein B7C62_10275 [Kitasatospora albolonga]|uniref:Uncharacterized protein n=1 Tax=Kitasatospora albolonga TaxID=68173 RepID=A0ABC8BQA3_9ACTN|nr:hypothetical protein B7C62_10275 [Kitasatospora albolonga]